MSLYNNKETSNASSENNSQVSLDSRIAEARVALVNNLFAINFIILFENRLIMSRYAEQLRALVSITNSHEYEHGNLGAQNPIACHQ